MEKQSSGEFTPADPGRRKRKMQLFQERRLAGRSFFQPTPPSTSTSNTHLISAQTPQPGAASTASMRALSLRRGLRRLAPELAARSWMADQGVPFELAEACLAHAVGGCEQGHEREPPHRAGRPRWRSASARVLHQAPDRPADALVRAMGRHRTAGAGSGSSRTPLIHPASSARRKTILSSSEGAQPLLRPLHLVVRETEFCGLRLAGEFRRRTRENGGNSVRRPRHASPTRRTRTAV